MKPTANEHYSNPAWEAFLKTSFSKLEEQVKNHAESMGLKNLPRLTGDSLDLYTEEHKLGHQPLLSELSSSLHPKTTAYEATEHCKMTEQRLREQRNKLAQAKERKIQIDASCQNSTTVSLRRFLFALSAVAVISLVDGSQTIPVYEEYGYSFIAAIFIGVLFSVGLALYAHITPKIIATYPKKWQRWCTSIFLYSGIATLFYYMATVRAEYLSSSTNNNAVDNINIHFSPMPFVITSMFMFTIAVAVCIFYMPTRQERAEMWRVLHAKYQQKANQLEIARIEKEIQEIQQENGSVINISASILEYGSKQEAKIINHYNRCIAVWKRHNLMHRPDSGTPDCFNTPTKDGFDTNFPTF